VKVGDLVRFTAESWGTPLEDRPLGIVVKEPYTPGDGLVVVDVLVTEFGCKDSWATDELEIISENR